MRMLGKDRIWTILFNLPLPLVLSTVVFAQDAAVELEPVIVSEPNTV